jgi:hypothetical protein
MATIKDLILEQIEKEEKKVFELSEAYSKENDPLKKGSLSLEIQDKVESLKKKTQILLNKN